MKKILLLSLSTALVVGASGCGSSSSSRTADGGTTADGAACATSSTGSVTVNVTGLPTGVAGAVKVTGPGGDQVVTMTKALASQKSGSYMVTASIVTQADPIVRKAFKATVSTPSAMLCDGQSVTIDVTYSLIATSNKVWWGSANSASNTLGYASPSLASTGAPAAGVAAVTKGSLPGAFDKVGNLWVIDGIAGSTGIKRYPADSLGTSGEKTPDVVITSDAFEGGVPGPASIAFDATGNMWIGVTYSKTVVELDAATLAATAKIAPKVVISNVDPKSLAFDASGNLWVGSADRVLKYASTRLAASTTAAADLSIEAKTPQPVVGTLSSALGLAFDSSKNLWVAYDGVFAKISPAEQGATGSSSLTPAVQIAADVLALPEGIAFDESGGLWFAYSAGKFAKFGQAQLTASGKIAP